MKKALHTIVLVLLLILLTLWLIVGQLATGLIGKVAALFGIGGSLYAVICHMREKW